MKEKRNNLDKEKEEDHQRAVNYTVEWDKDMFLKKNLL